MSGVRSALIVASYEYEDPGLTRLRAPAQDAEALAAVLGNPEVGAFEIQTVLNAPAHTITRTMERFFADRGVDDLLLLHYSGHGVKDETGDLYFAAANTELEYLSATGVSSDFVNRLMSRTRARRVVLLLDCCYAGAFERGLGTRGDSSLHLEERLSGRGRAVITASTAMEYAFEGTDLDATQEGSPSVFTSALVQGLSSGDADQDQDGMIGLDELYEYVYDAVRRVTPNQTPSKWSLGMQGELYVARRSKPITTPSTLPDDLKEAMDSSFPSVRSSAVSELGRLLRGRHAGLSLAARRGLEQLTADDSRTVAAAASATLAAFPTQRAPELPDEFAATASSSRQQEASTTKTVDAPRTAPTPKPKPKPKPPDATQAEPRTEPRTEPRREPRTDVPAEPSPAPEPVERRTGGPTPPQPRTPTEDAVPVPPEPSRPQVSRQTLIIAASVVLVLAAAAIVYAVVQGSPDDSSTSGGTVLSEDQAVVTIGNAAGGALKIVDVRTGEEQDLVATDASRATVTPDRTSVVYLKSVDGKEREARILGLDGSDDNAFFPSDPSCARSTRPAWSPDGEQLAVICTAGDENTLFTASADGSDLVSVLTPEAGTLAGSPTWAVYGGETVVIYSLKAADNSIDLWRIAPSGGEPEQITEVEGADFDPDWSAEGGLVFQRNPEPFAVGGTAYLAKPVEQEAEPLSLPEQSGSAVWSPDGEQLAYPTSDGRLAVTDPDGSSFSPVPDITDVSSPAWGSR